MKFNRDIHNRKSLRLQGYNYANPGAYFVTICARDRQCLFGTIQHPVGAGLAPAHCSRAHDPPAHDTARKEYPINLTSAGKIIDMHWRNIPFEYEQVNIDEYIVMPNHFHGIVVIHSHNRATTNTNRATANNRSTTNNNRTTANNRATARVAPTTLGQIIGSFKSKCVNDYLKYIRQNNLNEIGKLWQRNYYERIIRNEPELFKVRKYIQNNPCQWNFDEENPNNFE